MEPGTTRNLGLGLNARSRHGYELWKNYGTSENRTMETNMRMTVLKHSQWFRDMLRKENIDTTDFPYKAWWYPKHIHSFYWSIYVLSGDSNDLQYSLYRGKWK
jgi:hypothetical protein